MRFVVLLFTILGISETATLPTALPEDRFTGQDSYCFCGMVDGNPDGWDPKGIWLDIFIIFDVSASMADHLDEAKAMVTSFIQYMETDLKALIYSRVGVITVSHKAKVVYKLNMNSTSTLDQVQITNFKSANFSSAMLEANAAFNDNEYFDNLLSSGVQQVVYYLTKTAPEDQKHDRFTLGFKGDGGIIIVNDFGSDGDTTIGLKTLATNHFYFTDLSQNFLSILGVFCEANCYCYAKYLDFNDDSQSPRTRANRGCYQYHDWDGVSQDYARDYCILMGYYNSPVRGSLVSVHNREKDFIVCSAASVESHQKYWIALQNNGTAWNWDDKSTDPYSNWDVGQPDTKNGSLQCAYAVQTTGFNVKWSAINCDENINFVCETAPCSVGYVCSGCYGGAHFCVW